MQIDIPQSQIERRAGARLGRLRAGCAHGDIRNSGGDRAMSGGVAFGGLGRGGIALGNDESTRLRRAPCGGRR